MRKNVLGLLALAALADINQDLDPGDLLKPRVSSRPYRNFRKKLDPLKRKAKKLKRKKSGESRRKNRN